MMGGCRNRSPTPRGRHPYLITAGTSKAISPPKPVPKRGEFVPSPDLALTMKYGGNSSRRKAILKSCFRQFGQTSPLGIGYTAKNSKERLKTR